MIRIADNLDPNSATDDNAVDRRRIGWVTEVNRLLSKLDWGSPDVLGDRRYAAPHVTSKGVRPTHTDFGERDIRETMALHLGHFGRFQMRAIVEINAEYSAISLSASALPSDSEKCDPLHTAITTPAHEGICRIMTTDVAMDSEVDPLLNDIFHKFWNQFFSFIAGERESPRDKLFGKLGERVVEFQGVVLRTKFWRPGSQSEQASLEQAQRDLETQLAFTANNEDSEPGYMAATVGPVIQQRKQNSPGDDEGTRIRERLREFVNARPTLFTRILGFRRVTGQGPDRINAGNTVLCHLYRNKAIYGSSLRLDNEAVRYFLVYGGPSRHQLGRLVMTLHHCGELRFATLYDSEHLLVASDKIRILDMRLSTMRDNSSRTKIKKRNHELIAISQLCRGGLSYRIAQARFYQDALEKLLGDLRVRRILGWQSYDGVVRRNVMRRLDGIGSIGTRFDALHGRLLQLSDVQQQARLLHLQVIGEVFALIAATYYGGTILTWLFETHPVIWPVIDEICVHAHASCARTQRQHLDALHGHDATLHVAGYVSAFVIAILLRWVIYPLLHLLWSTLFRSDPVHVPVRR